MSVFGNILSAIFGKSAQDQPTSTQAASTGAAKTTSSPPISPAPGAAAESVDVAAILTARAAQKKEKLDWRKSIVDLMKLLDLDSSLTARKQLAQELNYTGDMNDSASMNIWLHKKVMQKLAQNGGRVPADLMD
jgi:hypothetical protein